MLFYKDIKKVLGDSAVRNVSNLLDDNISPNSLGNILNIIGNYVDVFLNGDYELLQNITLDEVFSIWKKYYNTKIESYSSLDYVEKNKIIVDYREDGVGFYWVDLEKEFCIESMIRMKDCGRVNYGNTTLELRKQSNKENTSHMIIVYEKNTGNIRQVKGKINSKPNKKYWKYFYRFLMDTDYMVNEYIPTYKPFNDLLVSDLSLQEQLSVYKKYPNLKNNKSII